MQALVLGIDGAGKTSVIARLCGEEVRTVTPTRGFTTRMLTLPGGVLLKLWDMGGRRDLRPYWPEYFEQAQAVIHVIDASDWRRMQESSAELQRLLDARGLVGIPLLVLANKQDLAGALSATEIEACLHLGAIRDRHWHCLACSALRKSGLTQGLRWLSDLHFPDAASGASLALTRAGPPSSASANERSGRRRPTAAARGPDRGNGEQEAEEDS